MFCTKNHGLSDTNMAANPAVSYSILFAFRREGDFAARLNKTLDKEGSHAGIQAEVGSSLYTYSSIIRFQLNISCFRQGRATLYSVQHLWSLQ